MQAILVLEKYLHVGVLTQLLISFAVGTKVLLANLPIVVSLSRYMSVDLDTLVPVAFYGMMVTAPTPTPTPTSIKGTIISSILPSWLRGYTPTGSLSTGQAGFPWSAPTIQSSMFTSAPAQASAYHFPLVSSFPGFAQGFGSFIMIAAAILVSLWAVGGWAVWGGAWYLKSKKK